MMEKVNKKECTFEADFEKGTITILYPDMETTIFTSAKIVAALGAKIVDGKEKESE